MIDAEDLLDGCAYTVEARNFPVAVWRVADRVFLGYRFKFGCWYLDQEKHWDDDPKYGTVKPVGILALPGPDEDLETVLCRLDPRKNRPGFPGGPNPDPDTAPTVPAV